MMVIREQKTVRLVTKGGIDWAKRFPWIVETALKLRQERFVLRLQIGFHAKTSPKPSPLRVVSGCTTGVVYA
jgi:ATP-dependent DNA ligase